MIPMPTDAEVRTIFRVVACFLLALFAGVFFLGAWLL